jgi:hypothetical protein
MTSIQNRPLLEFLHFEVRIVNSQEIVAQVDKHFSLSIAIQ